MGTMGNWIYIAGGCHGRRIALDDVQRINVVNDRTEKMSSLSQKMIFTDGVMVR